MKKSFILFLALLFLSTGCATNTNQGLGQLPEDYGLENAKKDDCVVFEDLDITSGQSVWDDFVSAAGKGESASVRLAYYYTLDDPSRYDAEYYEEIKDDYPKLFMKDLSCRGGKYVIESMEDDELISKEYQHLVKYEGEPGSPSATFSEYTYYVLVNDPDVSWEEIERGMLSSDFNDAIDHCLVYSDIVFK